MKKIFFPCLLTAALFMISLIPANAQDKEHKKIHVVIEENGMVTTDTSVIFDKDVSEQDIEAAISGITGEKNPPCHSRNETVSHCDTVIIEDNDDIIITKGNNPEEKCIKVIVESDRDTVMSGKTKEIRIIMTDDKDTALPEECGKKVIEKKIIITEEGDKAEKTIILESPADTEKKSKKEN